MDLLGKLFSDVADYVTRACWPVAKAWLHWWTGKGEVERVCDGSKVHGFRMSLEFALALWRSKRLQTWRTLIFHHRPFSVKSARDFIADAKKIPSAATYTLANLTLSLKDMRLVNLLATNLDGKTKQLFDHKNMQHEGLLESLWSASFPGERYPGGTGPDWGNLGFQGQDPASDFRGMGMLGLLQLVFFATHPINGQSFKHLLRLSVAEPAYFPFAATSINMTAFALELLRENRLHGVMLATLAGNVLLQTQNDESNGGEAESSALLERRFNEVFCELWTEFGELWVARRPKSVMDFPAIFCEFKKAVKQKYKWDGR